MERTINDSLAQLTRKSQSSQRVDKDGRILFVNYSNHSIVVKVNGYGVIKGVMVRKGIVLGTTDRQVVVQGDWATIHQKETGRWVCTGIERKVKCAIPLVQTDEVIVDTDTEFDTSNSYIQQLDSSFQLPDDLRLPPIEQLGQITLPAFRFPDTSTFLCGMPPCTDCGTPTVGMFIQISSDDDHPLCYKYSFRPGVGGIWILYGGDVVYRSSYASSTPVTPAPSGSRCISPSVGLVNTYAELDAVWSGNGLNVALVNSSDGGATWDVVKSLTTRFFEDFGKIKFDRSVPTLGWAATATPISEEAYAAITSEFFVAAGLYAYDPAESFPFLFNYGPYAPVNVHITTNSGVSWNDHILEYLAEVYRIVYNFGAPNFNRGAFPTPDCATMHMAYPTLDMFYIYSGTLTSHSNSAEFLVCADQTWEDNTLEGYNIQEPQAFWTVAPLHDGENCYVLFAINTATEAYDNHTVDITPGVDFLFTNRIYLVDSSGVFSGVIEIDVFDYSPLDPAEGDNGDYLLIAECDPTDTDKIYCLSANTKTIVQVSFGGASVTTLTSPYDYTTDLVRDLFITDLGTILIPVVTGAGDFIVYRSTNQGASFGSADLSAYADSSMQAPSIGRILIETVENILLVTNTGQIVYSIDDGVTWTPTGVILPVDAPTDIDG